MADLVAAVTHTGALVFTSRNHAETRGYTVKRSVTQVAPPKFPAAKPALAPPAQTDAPKES